MMHSNEYYLIFNQCIKQYHIKNSVDQALNNAYSQKSFKGLVYKKCWIDTVQWHLEDSIRDPNIDPTRGMELKYKIDKLNQKRTDLVEQIDDLFIASFKNIKLCSNAEVNTESPAWVVDRLSILALKIFHMNEQVTRPGVNEEHRLKSKSRLAILLEQKKDLSTSFDQLLTAYTLGRKKIKVYRQMKLYNDPSTNPIFYKKKN